MVKNIWDLQKNSLTKAVKPLFPISTQWNLCQLGDLSYFLYSVKRRNGGELSLTANYIVIHKPVESSFAKFIFIYCDDTRSCCFVICFLSKFISTGLTKNQARRLQSRLLTLKKRMPLIFEKRTPENFHMQICYCTFSPENWLFCDAVYNISNIFNII